MTAPDLPAFLLARLAEDEAVARAAADAQGPRWFDEGGVVSSDVEPTSAPGHYLDMYAPDGRWMLWDCEGATSLSVAEPTSAHMARHDPARVLADVESKRRVVALHDAWDTEDSGQMAPAYWEAPVEAILCALAQPYADHPDFDPSWRL